MVGIIIEANPFHNGHQYFINKIKELRPNEVITAVTSTSFTMRGEISIIDKFTKINCLLSAGVNLIFELPIIYTLQSSDYFAERSIKILNNVGVNEIICGSENDDINNIIYFYYLIHDNSFVNQFKENLKLHLSYKETYTKTLKDLDINAELINLFNSPNFTLAYQYYSAIQNINKNIKLTLIKRINDESLKSATLLKQMHLNNESIVEYLPFNEPLIDINKSIDNLNKLINFHFVVKKNEITYDNELINKLIKDDELKFGSYSNKNYTISRIRRSILLNLLSYSKKIDQPYLRLLGSDDFGLNYIHKLDKEIKQDIFSSPKEINNNQVLDYELQATKLYDLITNTTLYNKEYQLPIIKEKNNG